jgi:hypothetical protein
MQSIITYLLVVVAGGFTLYSALRTFFPGKKSTTCGHACGACPASRVDTKKGEPAELVPLEALIRR